MPSCICTGNSVKVTVLSFSKVGGGGAAKRSSVYLVRITVGHSQLVLSPFFTYLYSSILPLLVLLSQPSIMALEESLFCLITLDGGCRCSYGRFNLCNVPISPEDWSPSLLIQMQLRRHSTVLALCASGLRPVIIGSWHRTPLVPAADAGSMYKVATINSALSGRTMN